MKYVTVECLQANGNWKTRYIERNSIGDSLKNSIKMWLKKKGYKDQIDDYIEKVVLENTLSILPAEVQKCFKFSDCYIEVPLSEEKIEKLKNDIINTFDHEFEIEKEYYDADENDRDELAKTLFWQEVTDEDSFRLNTLSGYSRKYHLPYDTYLKEREIFEKQEEENKEDEELLDFLSNL